MASRVGETVLARIIRLIEDAPKFKSSIQALADQISSWFVPAVIILPLTFVIWYFVLGADLSFSLMTFTSVIVIACPCALGLATPAAIMVGTGLGAQTAFDKGGEPLGAADKIRAIIFDKTGTLTTSKPDVTDIISAGTMEESEILAIAASLEKLSEHSLAEAIYSHALNRKIRLPDAENFRAIPGHGVTGHIEGHTYYLGNRKLIDDHAGTDLTQVEDKINALEKDGKTVMILSTDTSIQGLVAVADKIKESSKAAIEKLKRAGLEIFMITGDNSRTAASIARQLGIKNVLAEVLPDQKAAKIKQLQAQGLKVAMVGDGINDSPALALADLGIAMGSGTVVAMETGGIVLIKNDLNDVVSAIKLSRDTLVKIKQNLFFALLYNIIGIPIAARALSGIGLVLKPELAGLAMALSSISVVSNSLLLKRWNPQKKDFLSQAAIILMILLFTLLFIQFSSWSSSM